MYTKQYQFVEFLKNMYFSEKKFFRTELDFLNYVILSKIKHFSLKPTQNWSFYRIFSEKCHKYQLPNIEFILNNMIDSQVDK